MHPTDILEHDNLPLQSVWKRLLVVGSIAAGKSHLAKALQKDEFPYPIYSIDDFRITNDASTQIGEERAQSEFIESLDAEVGIYECTGGGKIHPSLLEISHHFPFDCIFRVHTPISLSVSRCQSRNEWPPYPYEIFPDSVIIQQINVELDSLGFGVKNQIWNKQKLVHVRGW